MLCHLGKERCGEKGCEGQTGIGLFLEWDDWAGLAGGGCAGPLSSDPACNITGKQRGFTRVRDRSVQKLGMKEKMGGNMRIEDYPVISHDIFIQLRAD